ncbi:MAG: ThiF family adenylyltransferase [Planctomycetota bacterium]
MDRYSRQRLFVGIGDEGQDRLAESHVTLVGCGALGTHIAQHLVRAGVGRLRLFDRDFVELGNLQRQVLFDEADVAEGVPKAIAAEQKLRAINSEVEVDARVADVSVRNIHHVVADTDLVIDGTDNFETRYLLNDACVRAGLPWVYGGVVASHGMVLAVRPKETPCFACVVPDMPPPGSTGTCDTTGVIGPAVAVIAALEAAEAMKLLTGATDRLADGLITMDVWRHEYRVFSVPRNPDCRVCARGEYDFLRPESGSTSTVLCGRNAVQVTPGAATSIDFDRLEGRLSPHGPVRYNSHLLRFEADSLECTLFPDGRAVIQGTDQTERARAFYSRYIGS